MTNWDSRAQGLLAQARKYDRAPATSRAKVRASVAASVALSAGATATVLASQTAFAKLPAAVKAAFALLPTASVAAGTSGPVAFLAPVAVGLAIGLSAITPSQVTPTSPTSMVSVDVRKVAQSRPTGRISVAAVSQPTREGFEPKSADSSMKSLALAPAMSSKPVTASLSDEANLVEQARLVLRQGNAELALRLIDRHRSEFPNGVLFFEALGTRALALCKLGQTESALKVLSRMDASSSNRGLVAQVRAACGQLAVPDHEGKHQ